MIFYKSGDFYYYQSDKYRNYVHAAELSIKDMWEDGSGDIRFSINLKGRSALLDIQERFKPWEVLNKKGVPYGNTINDVLSAVARDSISAVAISTNNASGDAFGRLRTSEPFTIFDSKKLYGLSEGTYWSSKVAGAGSVTAVAADACVRLAVAGNGDYAIRQTRQRFNYQPGKSMLYYMTGTMNPTTGTTQRVGPFHGGFTAPYSFLDGLCFEHNGTTMSVRNYKGGVTTQFANQADWSMDKLDGTGPSGKTIDFTKSQIFIIDYEWLGVGRVRFGFNIDGETIYVHAFNNANRVTAVYMRSPNQPIRYEIRSTGGAAFMDEICCSVQLEGGFNPAGLVAITPLDMTPISIAAGSGWELVYAMRLKQNEADATVLLNGVSLFTGDNLSYQWAVLWNPIIAGSPVWTDVQGSSIQQVIGNGSTNTVTPIISMASGYAERASSRTSDLSFETSLRLGSAIDGTMDVIALAVKSLVGSGSVQGLMSIKQLV